jgi:hypothetical protein
MRYSLPHLRHLVARGTALTGIPTGSGSYPRTMMMRHLWQHNAALPLRKSKPGAKNRARFRSVSGRGGG